VCHVVRWAACCKPSCPPCVVGVCSIRHTTVLGQGPGAQLGVVPQLTCLLVGCSMWLAPLRCVAAIHALAELRRGWAQA
jgi:hypothetical protein